MSNHLINRISPGSLPAGSGETGGQPTRRHRSRWMPSILGRVALVVALAVTGLTAVAPAAEAVPPEPFGELSGSIGACQRIGGDPQLNDDFKSVTCVTTFGVYYCTPSGCWLIYRHVNIPDIRL